MRHTEYCNLLRGSAVEIGNVAPNVSNMFNDPFERTFEVFRLVREGEQCLEVKWAL